MIELDISKFLKPRVGWTSSCFFFGCCCCWDRVALHRIRWSSRDCTKISLGIYWTQNWMKITKICKRHLSERCGFWETICQLKKYKFRVQVFISTPYRTLEYKFILYHIHINISFSFLLIKQIIFQKYKMNSQTVTSTVTTPTMKGCRNFLSTY